MHPTICRLGPIEIYSYGVMLMVAFIAAILWACREGKRKGVKPSQIVDLSLWILVLGLIFARVVFILLNLDYYLKGPISNLFFWQGRLGIQGLSFHGALFGSILGVLIYAWRAKISWLTLADICAPSAALAYGFGRIGCFLNGCCYGAPTQLPWGIRFPETNLPSHPTQIYSTLGSWVIFGVLLWLRDRLLGRLGVTPSSAGRATPSEVEGRLPGRGRLFFTYLSLYSVMRFLIEFLRRGVTGKIFLFSLTEAQWASAALFVISMVLIFYLKSRKAETTQEQRKTSP